MRKRQTVSAFLIMLIIVIPLASFADSSLDYLTYNMDYMLGIHELNETAFITQRSEILSSIDQSFIYENLEDCIITTQPISVASQPSFMQLYYFTTDALFSVMLVFNLSDADYTSIVGYYYEKYGLPSNWDQISNRTATEVAWYGNNMSMTISQQITDSLNGLYVYYLFGNTCPDMDAYVTSKIDCLNYREKLGTDIRSMIEDWMVEGQEYTITPSVQQGQYHSPITYTFYINYDYFGVPRKYNIIEMTTPYNSDLIATVSYVFSWVHRDDTYTYSRILNNMIHTIADLYNDPAFSYISGSVYNNNATRDDVMEHIISGKDGLYIVNWDEDGCMLSVDISDDRTFYIGKIAFFVR